jgi:peptide-methionine (S)-S-oxide reductase
MNTRRSLLPLIIAFAAGSFAAFAADEEKPKTEPTPSTTTKKMETITLGAGCFWCVDAVLQRVKGIEKVVSGYSNGHVKNPTYKQVCEGDTGHAEVVQVTYDAAVMPLDKLLKVFFELHDPTTLNRQGNDVGTQYRSGIYFTSDVQKAVAEAVKAEVEKSGKFSDPIVTEIVKLDNYTAAEDYHQNYFASNYVQGTGHQGYCRAMIVPKLKKMGLLKPEENK